MGAILIIRRCIMMFSHREIYNISGIYNRVDVFMRYAKLLLYNMGKILRGYEKSFLYSMGKRHGVGVRYIKASLPIYIREILHGGTQNLSYISVSN